MTRAAECEIDPILADSDSDSDLTKSTPTPDRLRLRVRPIGSGTHLLTRIQYHFGSPNQCIVVNFQRRERLD